MIFPTHAITLLLVEDDKDAREVTVLMIARKFPDATIHSADNGKTGVELFKRHGADIVITDVNMPIMDGSLMAGEIKAIKPDTKFIVLTAESDKNNLDRFNGTGVNHYIPKPFLFIKLFAAIEECIAGIMAERHRDVA